MYSDSIMQIEVAMKANMDETDIVHLPSVIRIEHNDIAILCKLRISDNNRMSDMAPTGMTTNASTDQSDIFYLQYMNAKTALSNIK